MSTYLDEFGVADARREKLIKKLIAGVVIVAAVSGVLWYVFRDYREDRRFESFLALVEQGDYPSAYAMWGCTPEMPCRDYSYEKFMEDWGPGSVFGDVSSVEVTGERSCKTGIIRRLEVGDEEVMLWVGRQDGRLSYAPWLSCDPHYAAGSFVEP